MSRIPVARSGSPEFDNDSPRRTPRDSFVDEYDGDNEVGDYDLTVGPPTYYHTPVGGVFGLPRRVSSPSSVGSDLDDVLIREAALLVAEYDGGEESGVEMDSFGDNYDEDRDHTPWLTEMCQVGLGEAPPSSSHSRGRNVARLKAEKDESEETVECLYSNSRYGSGGSSAEDEEEDEEGRKKVAGVWRGPLHAPDCWVIVNEAVFPCSRHLLDLHSVYLRRQRRLASVLYLPEEFVSPSGFDKLYRWLDQGGGPVPHRDAKEMLDAAEFLGVKSAREACLSALHPTTPHSSTCD